MKRKITIGILVVAAIALIVWWCIPRKQLSDWIPAKSKTVVRMDVKEDFKELQQTCIKKTLGFDIPTDYLSGTVYFFITPNDYYALALTLRDVSAFRASLSGVEVKSDDEGTWIWTQTGRLALLTDHTLVAIGPGTNGERARMRHTLLVMRDAPKDESYSESPYFDALQTESEIAFATQIKALPLPYSTILRLALPNTVTPVCGTIEMKGDTVAICGALFGKEVGSLTPQTLPSDDLLYATIYRDGKSVLQRLKNDALGRYLFTSLNDSVDAKSCISKMQAPISLSISNIRDNGSPDFAIRGSDTHGDALVVGNSQILASMPLPTISQGNGTQVSLHRKMLREAPLPEIFSSFLHALYPDKEHSHFVCNEQGGFCFIVYP